MKRLIAFFLCASSAALAPAPQAKADNCFRSFSQPAACRTQTVIRSDAVAVPAVTAVVPLESVLLVTDLEQVIKARSDFVYGPGHYFPHQSYDATPDRLTRIEEQNRQILEALKSQGAGALGASGNPLEVKHCAGCHNPAGQAKDSRYIVGQDYENEAAMRAEILYRLTTDDPQAHMPKGKTMEGADLGSLLQEFGAAWRKRP